MSSSKHRGGGGGGGGRGSARGGRSGGGKPFTNPSRVISDPRFAHAHTDPRFQRPRTAQHSFQPDARFNAMFSEGAFGSEAKVDKWGRRVASKSGERLKKFYGIGEGEREGEEEGKVGEEKEEEEKEDEEDEKAGKRGKKQKHKQGNEQAGKKQSAPQPAATVDDEEEKENEDDEAVEQMGASDEEVEEDADDTYTKSYLSSRTVAPPSSNDDDDDDDNEPASPTFPNILGSDSDDSDIEPLYTQADADEAAQPDLPDDEQIALGDATDTLALVNMDWDRLRAVDIYMLCRSFVSEGDSGGRVVGVAVYRSEFGKERMVEEEKYGPIGLYGGSVTEYRERIDKKVKEQMEEEEKKGEAAGEDEEDKDEDDRDAEEDEREEDEKEEGNNENEDDDEAEEQDEQPEATASSHNTNNVDDDETPLDQEKLRQYELSRLRYFYAIIRCSSIPAATALYTALDNSEFESSANKLDLRFVPADTHFDAADVRDQCDESDMDERAMTEYRAPAVFVTKALQHSRVELTWDADDEERKRKLKASGGGGGAKGGKKGKKGVEVDEGEDDLRVYLASDDEEDGYGSDAVVEGEAEADEEEKPVLKKKARARYTALLSELKGQKAADTEKGSEDDEDNDNDDDEEEDEGERVIEMTFEPGLKAKAEELVKRVTEREQHKNETAFERRAREAREKKTARKKANRAAAKGQPGEAEAGQAEAEAEEEDVVDVDMEDDFFKSAFEDDEYLPAKEPVADRAKAFFADDGRKEREDKKLNRERRGRRAEGDEEDDEEGGGGKDDEEKKRQAELELLLLPNQPGEEDETEGKKHYHLSQLIKANKDKSKSKATNKKNKPSTTSTTPDNGDWHVDVTDPRFAAMYSTADYSIDPTHPDYKPTAEMERVLAERQRRRLTETKQREHTVKQRKAAAASQAAVATQAAAGGAAEGGGGLDALVASVRAKARARESEVEERKRKDAEVLRKAAASSAGRGRGVGGGGKRLGEQPLQANNKKQKLKGEAAMRM